MDARTSTAAEEGRECEQVLQEQRQGSAAHADECYTDDGQRCSPAQRSMCSLDGDMAPVSSHPNAPQQKHNNKQQLVRADLVLCLIHVGEARGRLCIPTFLWCERGATTSSVADSARIREPIGVTERGGGGRL